MEEKKDQNKNPEPVPDPNQNPTQRTNPISGLKEVNVDALLGLLEFKSDSTSHIHIKDATAESSPCANKCHDKPCTSVCPAKVYVWEKEQAKIIVNYENCIECGACRMLCPFDNIKCTWPRGGFGVQYKMG